MSPLTFQTLSCTPLSHSHSEVLAGWAYFFQSTHSTCSFLPRACRNSRLHNGSSTNVGWTTQGASKTHVSYISSPMTQGQSVQEWPLHTEVHPEADVPNDLCPACCSGKPRAGICGEEVMVVNPVEFGVTSAACNRPPRNKIRPLSGCYAHTQREKQWPGHLHRDEKGWIWLHQSNE